MIINTVISYKNAWGHFNQQHSEELQEILQALPEFVESYLERERSNTIIFYRDIWEQKLVKRGWQKVKREYRSSNGQRFSVGNIGPLKNGISASISFGHIDFLNRWLFQQTTLAVKYQIAEIPILLLPTEEFGRRIEDRFFNRLSIEMCLRQLEPLTPLSHSYPFLILGYSDQPTLLEPEVIELESDPLVDVSDIVIDRCIEFPSEYYQAGLNILNYFGTYLREQYPDENAKVKIEQNGQIVRLIIETNDGEKEIVEKALEEYQLIVTGQKKPEEITTNQRLILELNSELRIAKYRMETQQDIIQVQRGQIDQLFLLIGTGLVNKNPINIDFRPVISLTNQTTINNDVSYALSNISELKELFPMVSPEFIELQELEGSLVAIESEQNPEVVKNSSAMKKFKKFVESVSEGNTEVSKILKTAENGWETFKNLAGKYNKIAAWCGLPQVPSIFTK
jgi:uncharacterized protein YggU (UPF0235/DUF167 family)